MNIFSKFSREVMTHKTIDIFHALRNVVTNKETNFLINKINKLGRIMKHIYIKIKIHEYKFIQWLLFIRSTHVRVWAWKYVYVCKWNCVCMHVFTLKILAVVYCHVKPWIFKNNWNACVVKFILALFIYLKIIEW